MAPVSQQERLEINSMVARFESATGVQAVAAVTPKADAYPEIPWKAFALGASLAGMVAAFHPAVIRIWSDTGVAALDAMLILGCGVLFAALSAFIPVFGRLLLDRVRARAEAQQYAKELFLERELFRTRSRRAVLVVMCRFEGLAVIVADSGLAQYAPPAELGAIGEAAGALQRKGDLRGAFALAFERVETLLEQHGMQAEGAPENELDDDVLVGRSA
jgi:putative membrane protein